ncbi:MAG TPA: dienelactone hydrolase family protein [Stellaceae bacterium]|jgi:dienelactone hydrolase
MIKSHDHHYLHETTTCEGFWAYDEGKSGKRPGILVAHEWNGLGDYVKKRCEMLAEMGYVAFAADIFGKGIRAKSFPECEQISKAYYEDRQLTRGRAQAALDCLKSHPLVDASKIAAIGYCFGGIVALELARSGADIKGTVAFHGQLSTPNPADAKNIKGKVLICHGAIDPVVPPAEVAAFEKEMEDAKVDWQLIAYGGAMHTFTNWGLPTNPPPGMPAAYNEKADKRSWKAMTDFFAETIG